MSEMEAAATQIGQLIPGQAENRIAAPRAEVRMAVVQATADVGERIGLIDLQCAEYFTLQSKLSQGSG